MPFKKGQSGNPDTQFKPGESGNPDGKPKGTVHLSTHIQNMLNDEEFVAWVLDAKEGIKQYKGAPVEGIIKALIVKAINGDTKAFDALAKYGYGTKIDLTSGGEPIKALVQFIDADDK